MMGLHSYSQLKRSATVVAGALALIAGFVARAQQPNVVLIVGDDQAWADYGFMGHDVIETPHLDALANEGLVYTRGYLVTSLCRPSLATLATGMYPHTHGITGNDPVGPRKDRPELNEPWADRFRSLDTVAELLGEAGYASHQSGKWWEGHYSEGGFTAGMTHGDPERGGRHGDEGLDIGRKTMEPVFDFIDNADNRPFFLWYAPFLPHLPHNPPERLLEKYRAPERDEDMAVYYAMCEWLDETCGELIGHLEERGLRENTLIVFLGDNGWIQPTSDNPAERRAFGALRGKRTPYEGGVRTPIVVSWPGHTAEERLDTPVSSVDIVPTILDAAGVAVPEALPGLNLLDRDAVTAREAVFGGIYGHDMEALEDPAASLRYRYVVDLPWKLIVPHEANESGPVELFNVVEDPWERENVAAEHGEVVEALRARMNGWWAP